MISAKNIQNDIVIDSHGGQTKFAVTKDGEIEGAQCTAGKDSVFESADSNGEKIALSEEGSAHNIVTESENSEIAAE